MTDQRNDTILIVDDNPANLSVLSDCLESCNFEVLIAQNGESAIQRANYAIPDLIVLDVMMPGIDGFETCKRLKENLKTQDIPVILMTALSDIDNKVKGLKSGAVDYITKPFQQEEVVARINIHLNVHHLTQEVRAKNSQLQKEIEERISSEKKLQNTLKELRNTQAKLVQSEKISGLGRIVAGICHEFNNPIGFIVGNIRYLKKYTDELLNSINIDSNDDSDQCSSFDLMKEKTINKEELEYIVNDIPKIIASIESGTDRITDIIDRLKKFSYLDQSGKKPYHIHDGLDQTIDLINHRLAPIAMDIDGLVIHRPEIQILKEYDQLPPIYCYPDQIHQAFLNLITNSLDAIDTLYESLGDVNPGVDKASSPFNVQPPRLTIRTKRHPTSVSIHIIDNGPGIPEEIQSQIFDPFFTTKVVGKGVGLGLAICFQIVTEMHGGCLNCHSSSSETEMVIELPFEAQELAPVHPN